MLADSPSMPKAPGARQEGLLQGLESWVKKGGNLVLTDGSLHALADMGLVEKAAVQDIKVYQPYSDFQDLEHHMVKGLRPNARQLVESPPLGYCIGDECSPMTTVAEDAFTGIERARRGHHRRRPSERRRDQARVGRHPDHRWSTADADREARPPVRAAQLRDDVHGPVHHGEQHHVLAILQLGIEQGAGALRV